MRRLTVIAWGSTTQTNESPEWGRYWARYIRASADQIGLGAECTEMWDDWNLLAGRHLATFDHPETYSFVDLSQNNHQPSDHHWANPQVIRTHIRA